MGNSKEEVSLDPILTTLKTLFKNKGYPEEGFIEKKSLIFSYKNLSFEILITLVFKHNSQTLFIVDYKPQQNLTFSERGMIALARVFFDPPPYFILITNLKEFILINPYTGEKKKGDERVIPEFITLKDYKLEFTKSFDLQIEKKILAIYLSGG